MKPARYILHAGDAGAGVILHNAISFLTRLTKEKSWEIEIREWHKPRSPKQRKALFGVAYKIIMEHVGLEGEDEKRALHRYFCGQFFGLKKDELGRDVPVRTTTKNERGEDDEISTLEALKMYAHIQRRAAENGIDVPDPDPALSEEGHPYAPAKGDGV